MTLSNNQVHELLDYLNAREREREALAGTAAEGVPPATYEEQAVGEHWAADRGLVVGDTALWDCEGADTLCMATVCAEHVAAHDPSWTKDDVFVKSYLLALFAWILENVSTSQVRAMAIKTLQVMGRTYETREDFKPEWRYKPDLSTVK